MKPSELITQFLSYLLTEKRVSENTVIAYRQDLKQLQEFCTKNQLDITLLERNHYADFLAFLQKKQLSARSISRKIAALKGLFAYAQQYHGITDYAKELVLPKMKRSLPHYLSLEELEKLFESAQKDRSLTGKRNKIMLYLMYVTGMRVSELITLPVAHVHRDTATIAIEGKRGRQRLVPLPDRMMQELITYLDQTRPALLAQFQGTSDYLFPVVYGKKIKALTRQAFWFIIKQLWRSAGIVQSISPHVLRHSFATHMLNKGANLRSLQMLLGHEQLATVQVYTHVDTNHLRKIYDKKHPRS
jgi:integrase/recombinase XerD